VYGALFCFVAGELDVKADFSYFHTARASESTRKVAASATDKLKVVAFFPQLNEVGSEVSTYLDDVARGLPNVEVRVEDRLLVPQLAKDMKVFDDGVIVVERGTQQEKLTVGTDMQAARAKLKTLDADFQKSLLKVLRAKKTAYFTVGHGELNDAQPTPQNEGRTSKGIRELIDHQNYTIRDLSAATGLATDVPDDATLVLVVGPQQALLPEEIGALKRFAARGGSLFLCLDPEPKIDNQPLADVVGVTLGTSVLANDKVHMRRRFNDSDRIILATNRFSSHASVSTLSRVASHPVIFLGATSLDPGKDASFKIDLTVRGMPDTFNDDNGDFKWEAPEEKKNQYGLVAAVSKTVNGKEARAVVVGDADAVSDAVLGNEGNVLLVADAVRWLSGEESFAGVFSSAEDVRIEHTKQKDLVWFYGTIFGAPAIVLGLGLLYTRRIRRTKKKPAPPPPADAPKPPKEEAEDEEEAA
jgi:hypothetical protein